jgi:hypothetical protein
MRKRGGAGWRSAPLCSSKLIKSVYLKMCVTSKATPYQKVALKAVESASPKITALRSMHSPRSSSASSQEGAKPTSREPVAEVHQGS